jgi:integrase
MAPPTLAGPKTQRSRRTIAIDQVTVDVLRRHRAAQARKRLGLGPAYQDQDQDQDQDLVFCFQDGKPLDPDGVTQRFQRHAREAKLPVLRFHDLRHTHATLGLQAEVHPKVMQERLGHSSVAFTLDIYSHALPTMQGEAAQKVAALSDPAT